MKDLYNTLNLLNLIILLWQYNHENFFYQEVIIYKFLQNIKSKKEMRF